MQKQMVRLGVLAACAGLALALVAGCGGPEKVQKPSVTPGTPSGGSGAVTGLQAVKFQDPVGQKHRSGWSHRSKSTKITRDGAGLKCEVVGQAGTSTGQYGGIMFPVNGLKAIQFDISLINPDAVDAVFIDGMGADNKRLVRWQWRVHSKPNPPSSAAYTLNVGESKGMFKTAQGERPEEVRAVHMFIRLRTHGGKAGFTVQKLAVGE